MDPSIPCELVRGYLDFSPHAWNIVLIKRGAKWVRMLIDACRPLDIREEKDTEYFCRYVPPESEGMWYMLSFFKTQFCLVLYSILLSLEWAWLYL